MKIGNFAIERKVIWVFFIVLFLILSASIILNVYSKTEAYIKKINSMCEKNSLHERQGCLRENILSYVDKNPTVTKELFDSIWKMLQDGEIHDDARIFSPIVHEVGMVLASKNFSLEEAMKECGLNFRGGCTHGVFMEYVDRNYKNVDADFLIKECYLLKDKIVINSDSILKNCIHGVGHELVVNMKGTLNDTLLLCNKLPDSLIGDCVYGVFMEYSTGEVGLGYHSEESVGRNDPDCFSVEPSFKKICNTSLGFYRQYEVGSEPWADTYLYCENTPIKYRQDCFNGVGGALLFSNAFTTERAEAICRSLPEKLQGYCIGSM